jgi:hypothetical protein
VGDHPVQELEGEEMDADVGSRVDQRPVLHRQLALSLFNRIQYSTKLQII